MIISSFMIHGNPKVSANNWTKFDYFIFEPSYIFTKNGRIMNAEDFIFKCRIRRYGVMVQSKQWVDLYRCQLEDWSIIPSRKQTQIFESQEECLKAYQGDFDWITETKRWLENTIVCDERGVENYKKSLEESRKKLEDFNSLISE